MRINKYLMPILTLLALFGVVLTAKATDNWSISGKQTIDIQSLSSADDIRGWMTLEQISTGYDIPQPRLYQLLNIPEDIALETALKDMEGLLPDFEVSTVRTQLAEFLENKTNHIPAGEYQSQGDSVGPTAEPANDILPGSQIKGRHTLAEISSQCQVQLPTLLDALGLPKDTNPDLAAKDLVEQGSIKEIQFIRDAVSSMQTP